MIVNAIIHAISVLVQHVLSALPVVSLPDSLTGRGAGSLYGTISGGMSSLAGINGWIPIDQVVLAVGVIVAVIAAGFAIRTARIVASFLTLGGGA